MIEIQIQELTKAVHRLCDIIESKQLQLPLTSTPPAEQPKAEAQPPAEQPKREPKPKAEPKAEPKAATPAPAPAPVPTPAPAATADTPSSEGGVPSGSTQVTLTDLRGVGRMVLKNGKSAEMRDLIAKHEAESLTTLDSKHYASVLEGLKKLASSDV